ncbi:MAG: hypothetical protein EXR86_05920 [Gammaproteobacteria bacterium]|nr:hypothetical protein [Gammaproteobacteria bacterium]
MTSKLTIGLLAIALDSIAHAAPTPNVGYCAIPYLYATNIRSACEQYGSRGMAGLYLSNRAIITMLSARHKTAESAH